MPAKNADQPATDTENTSTPDPEALYREKIRKQIDDELDAEQSRLDRDPRVNAFIKKLAI